MSVRILGILIVVLGLAAVVLIAVMRTVVTPALRRRNIARLEEENERLDALLRRDREHRP